MYSKSALAACVIPSLSSKPCSYLVSNFEYVSKIFKGIIQLLFNFNDNIDESQNKINYEICQGFCIYNMKQNDEFCQNCGVLCLKELIISLNFFLKNNKYNKYFELFFIIISQI
jgi:predicted transcriptional regulator YdeE